MMTDLRRHRRRLDEVLAGEVAAALGQLLVLEVEAGGAGLLEQPDGPLRVERLAEAGVGVAQQRQGGGAGDGPGGLGELGGRQQADVGDAGRGRQGGAGEVDCPEAEALGHAGDQRVEDAGRLDGAGRPGVAQAAAGGGERVRFHDRGGLLKCGMTNDE